jgi:hypothetical protein
VKIPSGPDPEVSVWNIPACGTCDWDCKGVVRLGNVTGGRCKGLGRHCKVNGGRCKVNGRECDADGGKC